MALDERYGVGVSSLSPLFFRGETHMRPNEPCQPQDSAGRFFFHPSRSWSLTASIPRPKIAKRWRALAPEETRCELQSPVWMLVATPAHKTGQSLGPIPLTSMLTPGPVAAREGQSSSIMNPGITLALIKSRGRKNGVGVT